jgi:hypothetical protein
MFKSVYCTLGVLFDYSRFRAILSALFARHLDLAIYFMLRRRCGGGTGCTVLPRMMGCAAQLPAAGKITQKVSSFISGG